jgi:hypothetical protein
MTASAVQQTPGRTAAAAARTRPASRKDATRAARTACMLPSTHPPRGRASRCQYSPRAVDLRQHCRPNCCRCCCWRSQRHQQLSRGLLVAQIGGSRPPRRTPTTRREAQPARPRPPRCREPWKWRSSQRSASVQGWRRPEEPNTARRAGRVLWRKRKKRKRRRKQDPRSDRCGSRNHVRASRRSGTQRGLARQMPSMWRSTREQRRQGHTGPRRPRGQAGAASRPQASHLQRLQRLQRLRLLGRRSRCCCCCCYRQKKRPPRRPMKKPRRPSSTPQP